MLAVGAAGGWPAPSLGGGGSAGGAAEVRSGPPAARPSPGSSRRTYTVLQMNLCLSGFAGCFPATAYPAGVDDAVARIRRLRPDAVTITEACQHDTDGMAARLGYSARFARVWYAGKSLYCVGPSGRGLFGVAVLTRSDILTTATRPFRAQSGPEQRRWMCVGTRRGVDVCTAHLETPYDQAAAAARDAQCAELATVLAARTSRAFVFGGDVNRLATCSPPGTWRRADSAAEQNPGIQHVYGGGDLHDPVGDVLPFRFSDHDMLLVGAEPAR